ncbi:MAG: HAD family phosphatase [Bacteroidales bacterium]|nr:HAD family phosphatase [Bacteroidales bacterium]
MNKNQFKPYPQKVISNIIFDLGNVVLDIDYERTIDAFRKLGVNISDKNTFTGQVELFNQLDCGLNIEIFRAKLLELVGIPLTSIEIDRAWNALLLDWNMERLEMIQNLRKYYKVFLLSNTNKIHFDYYNDKLLQTTGKNLHEYFDKTYLSFEMEMRKPNPEIFLAVIKENNLQPNKSLYIDDTEEHLISAQKLGFITYHLNPQKENIVQLFTKNEAV